MPASAPAPSGAPCWSDLYTSDPDRAVEFYGALFGWSAQEPSAEHGGYVNFTSHGALIAGMMPNDGSSGQPDGWTTYLSVPDAKAAALDFYRAAFGWDVRPLSDTADFRYSQLVSGDGAAEDSPFGRLARIADPTGVSVKIVGVPVG